VRNETPTLGTLPFLPSLYSLASPSSGQHMLIAAHSADPGPEKVFWGHGRQVSVPLPDRAEYVPVGQGVHETPSNDSVPEQDPVM